MRRRPRGQRDTQVELDITSFLNLMVILIPFLLLNAVFIQVSIVSVDQPSASSSSTQAPPDLILDILVYPDQFVVNNRNQNGHFGVIAGKDYAQLNQLLREIKTQYPKVNSATLNVADVVDYQHIISTMDAVRIIQSDRSDARYPLFPELQLTTLETAK
jgi:biopolymer transport protein ExbD